LIGTTEVRLTSWRRLKDATTRPSMLLDGLHVLERVTSVDLDGDGGVGASSTGALAGYVEHLALPCDPRVIAAQRQRDEAIRAQRRRSFWESPKPKAAKKGKGATSPKPSSKAAAKRAKAAATEQATELFSFPTPCTISFAYDVEELVVEPPATLHLRSIRVDGLLLRGATTSAWGSLFASAPSSAPDSAPPSPAKSATSAGGSALRRPSLAPTAGGMAQYTGSDEPIVKSAELNAPAIKVALLEVGEKAREKGKAMSDVATVATPAPWTDAAWELRLPSGSPRPPFLRIELWDHAREGAKGDKPELVTDAEVRLAEGATGSADVALHYSGTSGGSSKTKVVKVNVAFSFELVRDA
jgi:hypothetical protein